MNQVWGPVAGIVPSRYTSLISLRFTVQWIRASLVAHLYLLYEDTRIRYSTLLYYYSTTIMLVLYLPAVSSSFFLLHTFSDRGAWERYCSSQLSVTRSPPVGEGSVNIYLFSI